jgi:hypothetical protein
MLKPSASVVLFSMLVFASDCSSQDYPTATAPPNLDILEHTPTGVLYADQELVKQHKQLQTQLNDLRGRLFSDVRLSNAKRDELAGLETELQQLRTKIDKTKFHAQPFGVFTQRDTQSFDLGEAQQIVITSDDVILRGWNGKNIKCVIEKSVLAAAEPEASEFAAIAVKHETRLADDLVGLSDQARAAGEQEFLASEAGQKLTEQGRKTRAKIVDEIHNSYSMYRPLQGHAVDVLQIAGLTGQEGNKHLTGRTESKGGGATLGGYWKRSAKVTIYVPNCRHVAVRGCQKAVDIKSLQGNLIVTADGSQDRSYGSDFAIRDIDGDVTIDQAPIRVIQGIRGNLHIQQTREYTNTGTRHSGGLRTSSSPPPTATSISEVTGALSAQFVRADLHLEKMGGTLDVINEYGNTTLKVDQPLRPAAHRVLSHSGVVRAITPTADTAGIPIFAFTQTGTAQVAYDRDAFEDRSFSNAGRSWYGFQSASGKFDFLGLQRPQLAWANDPRGDGVDLISNGGAVIVGPVPQRAE